MPNPTNLPHGFTELPFGARIADLLAGNVELHAWCGRCGRLAPTDAQALARRHGDLARIDRLARNLRCSIEFCQARQGRFFVRECDRPRIAPYR